MSILKDREKNPIKQKNWPGLRTCLISSPKVSIRSEEHTSELQSRPHLVCRLLLEKKKELDRTLHIGYRRFRCNFKYRHSHRRRDVSIPTQTCGRRCLPRFRHLLLYTRPHYIGLRP